MSESTKKKFYQTDGFRMFMGKYGIGVILIFMILVIGVMKPRFLYPSNILNVLTQISVNCLIAYGMCLCITTGGIDLSVGPQLALVSVLLVICRPTDRHVLGKHIHPHIIDVP